MPDATARRRDFHRLLAAAALSKLGTQVSYLAIPLVAVLTLDAGPGQVGLLGALSTVAFVVVGLPAGAWLDRVRRRGVMVAADVVRGLLLAWVPVAWLLDALTLTQLYVVVLLSGVATVFFDVAAQSYLPHVVGRSALVAANSRLASVDATAQVAGPAASGWLVQLLGAPLAVALDAVSYLWSAGWLLTLRRREAKPAASADRSLVAEVRDGVSFVVRHPVLRAVVCAGALTNLAVSASLVMVPIVFIRQLGEPEAVLGLFLAAGGVGGLLGVATARPVSARLGEGRSLWLLGLVVAPLAVLVPLVGTAVPVGLAAVAWAAISYKIGYDNVLLVSFRQQVTPDSLLGRVNATMRVLLTGAVVLGAAAAGLLGELAGPRAALWAAAAVLAVIWVPVYASPLRHARTLTPPASVAAVAVSTARAVR